MATTKVTLSQSASIVDQLEKIHDRISERAYELFRTSDGRKNAEVNWLKAEQELLWQPAVEVCQQNGQFEVRAAVAGVNPKDLAVTVTSTDVLISGNHSHQHDANRGTVHLCEFSRGQLFRPIHLPEIIDTAKVTAKYENGLLTVTAPIARSDAETKTAKART
jgi:HSP20 family protein